jgi:DNA-binding transcriptional MerR regulator/effector-binding domain-containing protein
LSGLFFRTGEFAALCGVKKDTLLHYDHIGILNPEKVDGNGYRSYSIKQLYTFDLITALKRLGMSLQEIKAYLDQRSPDAFLSLLHQQQNTLEQERKRLDSLSLLLQETILTTQLALDVIPGHVHLEHCPAEYYVAIEAPDYAHYSEPQFLLRSRSLLHWARENGSISFPLGDIVTQERLLKNSFVEDYYYCRVSPETRPDNVLVKPAGTYAVLYHKGSYESLERAYEALAQWVWDKGYSIIGSLFEEDLLHYMSTSDPNHYIMKISVQVDETPCKKEG